VSSLVPGVQKLWLPRRGYLRLILAFLLITLGGCIDLRSDQTSEPNADDPVPTPAVTPATATVPGSVEASLLLLRHVDDSDQVLGSAIVLSEDGLLLTEESVARESIEVVLPDGSTHRPPLVTTNTDAGIALIKVPADNLDPIEFGSERPGVDSDIYATGFDGTPPTIGRISGDITETVEPESHLNFLVRGAAMYQTDIALPSGFRGGALTSGSGTLVGIVVPGEDDAGDSVAYAVSNWFIQGWLQHRDQHVDVRIAEANSWETIELPGDWEIAAPEGWGVNVSVDSDDAYRAELTPGDPDALLQLAYSVEPNDYGTNIDEFISTVFEDRSSARIWTIGSLNGFPYVRATISQEGALVDVAYVLDETYLIAVSLTSGYQLESDQPQVDEARTLFAAVVNSLGAPPEGT
jgi:hypothetical protein